MIYNVMMADPYNTLKIFYCTYEQIDKKRKNNKIQVQQAGLFLECIRIPGNLRVTG